MPEDAEITNRIRIGGRSDTEITVELPGEPLSGPSLPPAGQIPPPAPFAPRAAPRAAPFVGFRALLQNLWHVLAPPISTTVSLGVPQAIVLTSPRQADDEDLRRFFVAGGQSYFLLHLACSFAPARGERVVSASVSIELTGVEDEHAPAPVAWSMEPLCLAKVTELSRTQKVDASLKIISVSVGGEQHSTRTECLVQAFNELQSDPRWEFRHARGAPLRGTQRLILVAQAQAAARASISLTANVRGARLSSMRGSQPLAGQTRPVVLVEA